MEKIFKLVGLFLCLGITIPIVSASDYFVYSELDTKLAGSYGPYGYVGADGIDRIIFYSPSGSSANAYIYKVSIPAGTDPNTHPDNPDAPGPIAPRTFTLEKTFNLGVNPSHESEFHVDAKNNVIYLGASAGIRKYVYDTTSNNYVFDSQIAPPSPPEEGYSTQSLAYDPGANTWYAGSIAWNNNPGVTLRDIWKYNGSQGNSGTWALAFQYTTSEITASHHDGMEFINGYLYLADYQGDYVKQYTTGGTLVKKFTYQPLGHELEGMGFGALKHFWVGSHNNKITEFGGGALQAAIQGIPDQCNLSGQAFATINLDSYATGTKPYTWTYSGNTNLVVSIDAGNMATITYPLGWTGSETITFTVTDANGNTASDSAIYTVEPIPTVGDIPDQTTPFTSINLDSYLSGVDASKVTWAASGNSKFVVDIDAATHIATVTNPLSSNDPETITFTATAICCNNPVSDSDSATFTPNRPPVAVPGGPYSGNEGSVINIDGSGSSDPDAGDSIASYAWDFGDGSTSSEAKPTHTYADNGVYTVTLTVTDTHGATNTASTTATVSNVAPTVTLAPSYFTTVPITLRIAGQGAVGNSVELQVIQDGKAIASTKITRTPGSPDTQEATLSATIDLSKPYSSHLVFDTEADISGGTPVWVIIDGVTTKVTTFNTQKKDPASHHQTLDFALAGLFSVIGKELTFSATASDPGTDDLTFDWAFGDGAVLSNPYPWNELHTVTDTVKHTYSAAGSYTVNLDVKDDDGDIGSASKVVEIS